MTRRDSASSVMSPLVSVVVPALNAAEWIDQALSSVVAQSYPREALEVIVVDDGSTDATVEVAVGRLRESGLSHRVLHLESTRGPSAARNHGWRQSGGEWVQFLDADDLIAPGKIAAQVRGAGQAPPELAVVLSPWTSLVEQNGEWVGDAAWVDPQVVGDPLAMVLRADNFIATGSQLFRRTWLETVGGYGEDHRLVEDVDLLMRIVMRGGQFLRVASATPLFWYRRWPGSLSSSDQRAFVAARVRNTRAAEEHWRREGALTVDRRQLLADLYASAVRGLAAQDPAAFDAMTHHIETLHPSYVPSEPERLRRLARVVGYRRAERTAVRYRRLKALVKRTP